MVSFKSIAIIGTREPTKAKYSLLKMWAYELASKGWIIRTGGAYGCDQAAMEGAAEYSPSSLHVYLPWASFNSEIIPRGCGVTVYDRNVHKDWTNSVELLHPGCRYLKQGALSLHARNYGIICHQGPVEAVIALPKTRSDWGGTGQGMRVADNFGISLYNLLEPGAVTYVDNWIHEL